MYNKTLIHSILWSAALSCTAMGAVAPPTLPATIQSYRLTAMGNQVEVDRTPLPWTPNATLYYNNRDKAYQLIYPESVLLVPSTSVLFEWNCFDFAFAPFMSDVQLGYQFPTQPQAWYMDDPSENWRDRSLKNQCTGYLVAATPTGFQQISQTTGQPTQVAEYAFDSGQIQLLHNDYYNAFGETIPLPVTDLIDLDDTPTHAAIAVDIAQDDLPMVDSTGAPYTGCFLLYVSKWGYIGGVWQHRWGLPFCPPEYCNKPTVLLFVPWQGWMFSPPYSIEVSF